MNFLFRFCAIKVRYFAQLRRGCSCCSDKFFSTHLNLCHAFAMSPAERRKRLLDDARDPVAFVKLGKDLVRRRARPPACLPPRPAPLPVCRRAPLTAGMQPFGGQDFEEVLQSMSSDDCLRVWDALAEHVAPDFDPESQVRSRVPAAGALACCLQSDASVVCAR